MTMDDCSMDTHQLSVTCVSQVKEVKYDETKEILVNTRVVAPPASTENQENERAPVSITAVIDRSGSMSGSKLQLVKDTLKFVVDNLKEKDSLGVVSYSDSVATNLQTTALSASAKEHAKRTIDSLTAGGCTNLAGGLYTGLQQQLQRDPKPQPTLCLKVGNLFMGNTWVAFVRQQDSMVTNPIQSVTFTFPSTFSPSTVTIKSPPFEVPQTIPTTATIEITVTLKQEYCGKQHTFQHTPNYTCGEHTTTHNLTLCPHDTTDVNSTLRSIWLFTDGHANVGDTSVSAMTTKMGSLLGTTTSCTVSTFGYGCDHNADLLRSLSELGHGMYYYMENPNQIGTAMVQCLAGLLSVYATDLKITLAAQPGAEILKVFSNYPIEKENSDKHVVKLGDIYHDEQRDILCRVKIHSLPVPTPNTTPVPVLTASYTHNIVTNDNSNKNARQPSAPPAELCSVLRTQYIPEAVPVPLEIDQQKNRIEAIEAMNEAKRAADQGQFSVATDLLQGLNAKVSSSTSAATPFVADLMEDVANMARVCSSSTAYLQGGQHQLLQTENMYQHQRACAQPQAPQRFQNPSQFAMVNNWNQQQPQPNPPPQLAQPSVSLTPVAIPCPMVTN